MDILACSNVANPVVDSNTASHLSADIRSPLDTNSTIQRLGKLPVPFDFRNALDSDDYPAWKPALPHAPRKTAQTFLRSQGWLLNALREQALENGLDLQIVISPRNDNHTFVYGQLLGGGIHAQENHPQPKDHETTRSGGEVALVSDGNVTHSATSPDSEKPREENGAQLASEDSAPPNRSTPPVERAGNIGASASPKGPAVDLHEPLREPAVDGPTPKDGTLLPLPVNCPRSAHVGPPAKQETPDLAIVSGGSGDERAGGSDLSTSSLDDMVDHLCASLLHDVTANQLPPSSGFTDNQYPLSALDPPSHPHTPTLNVTSTVTPIAKRQEFHRQLSSEDLTKALLGVISEAPLCYGNEPTGAGKTTPAVPGNPEASKLQEDGVGITQCAETNPGANQTVLSTCVQFTDASIVSTNRPLDCGFSHESQGDLPKLLPNTAGTENKPLSATKDGAGASGGRLMDTAKSPTRFATDSEGESSEDLPTGLFVCGCKSEHQILHDVIPDGFRNNVVLIQRSPGPNFFVACFDGPTIAKQIVKQLPQEFVETDLEKRTRYTPYVRLLLKDDLDAITGRRLAGPPCAGEFKVDVAARKGDEIAADLEGESKSAGE